MGVSLVTQNLGVRGRFKGNPEIRRYGTRHERKGFPGRYTKSLTILTLSPDTRRNV